MYILALLLAVQASASASASLLGVSPADYVRYYKKAASSGTFTCVSSTSSTSSSSSSVQTIPFSKVNDDYCDCPDGSDEPGTSACSMVPGARFYCMNIGDDGKYIHSSYVGDGVCDCCDGSDEQAGGCEDVCAVEGEKAMRELEGRLVAGEAGVKRFGGLVKEAAGRRRGWERRLEVLEGKEGGVAQERVRAEVNRKNAEGKLERVRAVVAGLEAKVEKDRQREREKEREREREVGGSGSEEALEDGSEEVYEPAEQVVDPEETEEARAKRIASQWIPEANDDVDDGVDVINYEIPEDDDDEFEVHGEDEDEDSSGSVVSSLIGSVQLWVQDKVAHLMGTADASVELRLARVKLEAMQKRADKASEEYNRKYAAQRELEHEMEELKWKLSNTYGEGDAYLLLAESCVESGLVDKFKYEVCPFGEAVQIEGAKRINIGHFEGFAKEGDENVMKFTNGDTCWNGPRRSMTVTLRCGSEDSFDSVSEPSRCEFAGVVTTPAVCSEAYLESLRKEIQRRKALGEEGAEGGAALHQEL